MTAKATGVLTVVLPSALVKLANMEPVIFESTVFADWGVAAIALRSSASASSTDRSLTRTPAPVMILTGSKCCLNFYLEKDSVIPFPRRP